ncbi:hypothetical protein ACEPAG_9506 [Sanghuangporus baumii]
MQNSSGCAETVNTPSGSNRVTVVSFILVAIVSRNANLMCSKMVSPFLDGADELSGALARFRHAADELWRVIDNCTSTLQKIDVEDCLDPFNTLGFLRATAHHYYDTFNDNQVAVDSIMGRSKKALKQLQSHVDSSAMKYGLNRLPTELLLRISLDIVSDMKSTITLSHVSKQFRWRFGR